MKPILSASVLGLLATACGSRLQPVGGAVDPTVQVEAQPEAEDQAPEVSQTESDAANSPTSIPDEIVLSPTPAPKFFYDAPEESADPAVLADIGAFAEMRNNLATGIAAPDFEARALGDWTFSLSAQRGSYVLVVPTAIGCADCVSSIELLAAAYPDYRDKNLKLVMLNLYPQGVPESWQVYADAFPGLGAIWGVVSSIDFFVDYDIRSLGTILLIDPEGTLVFRSTFPLNEEDLRRLFVLALGPKSQLTADFARNYTFLLETR